MARKKTRKTKTKKDIPVIVIVKRRGHLENYDERKVYGSSYFACRNAHLNEVESEAISEKVSAAITRAVKARKSVSSDYIFWLVGEELKKYNEDAAFLYETHRDIS